MKKAFDCPNCDWFTEDPVTGDIYYTSQGSFFKSSLSTNEKLYEPKFLDLNNLSDSIRIFSQYHSVKFSSMHSGKNISIHGGGTIATLGKETHEDYAVVCGVIPRGIVCIEFICPISCGNLSFGMSSIDPLTSSPANILSDGKKNFKSFRTSSRRRVLMEINYISRNVRFYLDGESKEKSLDFQKQSIFPTVIISNKNTSIVLNPFVRFANTPLPLFISPSQARNEDSMKTLLNNYLFIVDIPKIKINDSFHQEEFFREHFSTVGLSDWKVYIPIDESCLSGMIVVYFEKAKEIQEFKNLNKDAKIQEKSVNFLDKMFISEIVRHHIFINYDLKLLSKKEKDMPTMNMILRRMNTLDKLSSIGDYEALISKWFINNYERINFSQDISICQILKDLSILKDKLVIQNTNTSYDMPTENRPNKKTSVEYLPLCDGLILINESKIKTIYRNAYGDFDFSYLSENDAFNEGKEACINIIISQEELNLIIQNIPWKALIMDSIDFSYLKALYYFVRAVQLKEDIPRTNKIFLRFKKTFARIFVELILTFLNKCVFIIKERESIDASLSSEKKNEKEMKSEYDMELDKCLPFAPVYEEVKGTTNANTNTNTNTNTNININVNPNTLSKTSIEENYSSVKWLDEITSAFTNTELLFRIYTSILKIYEQISMNSDLLNDKRSNLAQCIRFNSAFSRMSTYVNYPFPEGLKLTELADNGFYVDNPLTNELKMNGYNTIRVLNTDEIHSSETLETFLNQNFPYNFINRSDFWPCVDTCYSVNVMPFKFHSDLKSRFKIAQYNKSSRVPLMITSSENGVTNIWNYSLGLHLLGHLNVIKGIKQVTDFKHIKEINWIRPDMSNIKTILEIFNDDNFDKVKSKSKSQSSSSLTKIDPKPIKEEKQVVISPENIENLNNMGFPLEACKLALKESKNNFDKALDYLLEKSADPDFNKKYIPGDPDINPEIGPWKCNDCTFLNEKGDTICEVCGAGIPEQILREFVKNKKDKKEKIEEKTVVETTNVLSEIEEPIVEFRDSLIRNIHIIYDNNDPIAPFIIAAVLFDLVLNRMTISVYKMMVNPILYRDFIHAEKDSFVNKIDNKKFNRLDDAIGYINEKYFNNVHTLYPIFVGPVNVPPNYELHSGCYQHLIPIEHTYVQIPIVSIFDSFSFERDGESHLTVLTEKDQGEIALFNFSIRNRFKFNNLSNRSLEIDYVIGKNIKDAIENKYPTELKIIKDIEYYYIIAKEGVSVLSSDFKFIKNVISPSTLGLFKKIEPVMSRLYVKALQVYDDNGKITQFEMIAQEEGICGKNIGDSQEMVKGKRRNFENVDVTSLTYSEINLLSQLLDFERIHIKANKHAKGLIPTETCNEYNKIFIRDTSPTIIEFSTPSMTIMANIEILFKILTSQPKTSTDSKGLIIDAPMNTPLPLQDGNSLKNLIPLSIVDYKGSQSQQNVIISSILFGEGRFVTNYPRPEFIFSHLHGNLMTIDSLVLGSDLQSKSSDVPFGEGVVFLLNSLDLLGKCKNYLSFDYGEYQEFISNKKRRNEEIFEWEPCCYVKMGALEYVRSKVHCHRMCKYIYFVPTKGRTLPTDLSKGFDSKMMSLILFAAEGSVSDFKYGSSDSNSSKYTETQLASLNIPRKCPYIISLSGSNENNEFVLLSEMHNLPINGTLPNIFSNSDCGNVYLSKLSLNNIKLPDSSFNKMLIQFLFEEPDPYFQIVGYTCEFLTFKNITKLNESRFLQECDINQLRRVIIDPSQFATFNLKFAEILFTCSIDEAKRLYILKYLRHLVLRIPSLLPIVEKSIDYLTFIKINIIECNSLDLINSSIDFLRLVHHGENANLIQFAIMKILEDFPILRFGYSGLLNFMSLLSIFNFDPVLLCEQSLKIINFCLKCIKSNGFQTSSHIYLKSHLKIEGCPFDLNYWTVSSSLRQCLPAESLPSNQRAVIKGQTFGEISGDTLRLSIDLKSINSVESIKLIFPPNESTTDSHFKVLIWGSSSKKSNVLPENFDLKGFKSFYDHNWKQLTKYEAVIKAKENLFNTRDIRSLDFDNIDFVGRYLIVEISLNQGQKEGIEFPALIIIPQVIGEPSLEIGNYEYYRFNELFMNYMPTKVTSIPALNRSYNIKQGSDMLKYLITEAEECNLNLTSANANVVGNNESAVAAAKMDVDKLKSNVSAYQATLEKSIQDVIKRRDTGDSPQMGKISVLIEDIQAIQNIISSLQPLMNLKESLSLNLHILKIFIKQCTTSTCMNKNLFTQAFSKHFPQDIDKEDFVLDLLEVCVMNDHGDLMKDTLELIKSTLWPLLNPSDGDTKIDHVLFHVLTEKYLSRDVHYRSALQIIEALSYVGFSVDIILQKLNEAFNKKWNPEEEISDAFFNISSLMILLIMKVQQEAKQISSQIVEIINVDLEFIKYLTKESKFNQEINDLILSQALNLLKECFQTTDFEILQKIIHPELIEYLVKMIFDLWENDDVKKKIMNIIDKLIDPFSILDSSGKKLDSKIPEILKDNTSITISRSLSDKITLNTQMLAIGYIHTILESHGESDSLFTDDQAAKFDYILNLLTRTYSINTMLSTKEVVHDSEDMNMIKKNNSEIIEMFINVVLKINLNVKIGYSNANNFWKYLTDIFERGSLEMMVYNNNFKNLIMKSFLNLDPNLQEILYTKLVRVFVTLYSKDRGLYESTEWKEKYRDMFDQIVEVILSILHDFTGTHREHYLIPFVINLSEVILSGEIPYNEKSPSMFTLSPAMKAKLFEELSIYLCQHLNLSSFTGSISGNMIIYHRATIARYLTQMVGSYISDYFMSISDDEISTCNFKQAIRNYLIFLIFDSNSDTTNNPPVVARIVKTWTLVNNIIDLCAKRKKLIEIVLYEIMIIVRKVDDCVFIGIRSGKMPLKNGMVIIDKLFSSLELLLNKCLQDDNITKFFAFELQGFKFFIDRVNTHRQHSIYAASTSKVVSNVNYMLNHELIKSLSMTKISGKDDKNLIMVLNITKEEEGISFSGNLNEYNEEEFALVNKLSILEGDISNPTVINNVNWSNKKKANTGHVYTRDMKDKGYFEESFTYSLPHLVELKDVMIGFNVNVTNIADKMAGLVPCVLLEAGASLDKMEICVKLDRIDDISYLEKCVIVYGFNFYSNIPDLVKLDDSYLENLFNQLINCRARYFRFIVRRPTLLSNENSHVQKITSNNIIIGINHLSLYGSKIADTKKVLEFIQEREKNVSIKIISKIFTAEFINTLRYIAQDSSTIDNIKQIYDAFEPYISLHATILSNILINVSRYNFELGEWLLNRLLNVENSEIHAKLAVEITQNNQEYVNERLNKFITFILRELNPTSPVFFAHDVEKKLKNIGKFCEFFTLTLNGLLISPYQSQVINLNIDFETFIEIIKNVHKYSPIRKDILKLLTILLIPNRKLYLNKFLDPEEAVVLLHNLYQDTFIFEYLEILSYLISANPFYEKIAKKKNLMKFYCEEFLMQINSGLRGKNMINLMEVLKNMSFSKVFTNVVREYDFDFAILDSIKNKNEKSDSILINNNLHFLNNVVIFLRNCIIDSAECHQRLAEILIRDLEICKMKIDKVYANNILMPLLRMEKVANLCIHPVDQFLCAIYSTYCNLSTESPKEDPSKSSDLQQNSPSVEAYLPNSQAPIKAQGVFKELFSKYEYAPKKTYANERFKCVFSSKTTEKANYLSALSSGLSGQGPFLLVLYPNKTPLSDSDLYTFFYCNSIFPTIPSTLTSSDTLSVNIPFTHQNFVCQVYGANYFAVTLKPDIDENTGKEYEIGYLGYDGYSLNLNTTADVINVSLLEPTSSTINPYLEVMNVVKGNGMTDLKYTTIKDYEIFVSIPCDIPQANRANQVISSNKILQTKYIDDSGNLSFNKIQTMKYYKDNHPLFVIRNNPIFEIPLNVNMKTLKEFLINPSVEFKLLYQKDPLNNELTINDLHPLMLSDESDSNNNIIDICYEIPSLRGLIATCEPASSMIVNYEPQSPVFIAFENLGGIRKIVGVLKNSIAMWKTKDAVGYWLKWIDDVEKFSELPSFFASLIRHQKCFDIIFNLLCGLYDNDTSTKETGLEANKYIYEILNNSFIATKSANLRLVAIEKGIFSIILERLEALTREKPRRFAPGEEESATATSTNKTEVVSSASAEKTEKADKKTKVKTNKKGIGYGSDQTGDNKSWDVSIYLEGKRSNSMQIASIISLFTNFFNSNELIVDEHLRRIILESPLLPVLESAFRGGTLLELAKDDTLYYAYLTLTLKLSENSSFLPFILDISKDYKPAQTQSILTLLTNLNDSAKIFVACIKKGANEEKTAEEKLANEITQTYDKVKNNVQIYHTHMDMDKHYGEILQLPVEKSYPLLMRELSFDYMSMKDTSGKISHFYASSMTGEATSSKMIRLAQEYADLSRALPCEHTNSIFVRVDQDNMDLLKVVIMGSEGTPYSNGAFEYDVFFDSQYPNSPPKVNMMTTGAGSTRFNPNLYANGKVCLSLLGTWRGQSTENWDPKISTLLQVLISIQSIIMSDLVYFNEPSCESEMGKPEGEAKNEAYSNIVRYGNIKFAMIDQIKKPSKGFEEVIRRHFYLKKELILKEVRGWIERSKTVDAKYSSFSYDHNPTWAQKMSTAKAYTKMLEDVYSELEKELNELPLPSELKQKTEESAKLAEERAKKKEKMEFIALDQIDVGYDNDVQVKEINIDDDAVKDRWSRYIGALGLDAVKRQANSSVFLSGVNGVGIEIAKNIVLSGCKRFVLHDTRKTSYYDLSSQFFLSEDDVGYNRAEASLKKLQQLNCYVKVFSSTQYLPREESDLDKFGIKDFNVVILTECDYDTQIAVNRYCRKRGIHFISSDVYGAFGRVINDFGGGKFVVYDKDGEELKECMIKSISNEEEGVITVLDGTRHNFQDGDEVVIVEVEGMQANKNNSNNLMLCEAMSSINGTKHTVKVINPQSFKIGSTLGYSSYIRNGIAKQIKTEKEMQFADIETCLSSKKLLIDENMMTADFTKMDHHFPLHIGFEALNHFMKTYNHLPEPWNIADANELVSYAKTFSCGRELTSKDIEIIYYLSFTSISQFPPLSAFFGGFVAQEAVKAMTGKFTPCNQIFYHDAIEILPEIDFTKLNESINNLKYEPKKNRTDGLQVIVGSTVLQNIKEMKILVVGSGAIGCELLKNYAMLDVGTNSSNDDAKKGAIYITDPDIIEVSNLNRQFLFREKHLRMPKSSTAAAAIMQMNKNLKNHIFAKMDKVCEETENIFTDKFFSSLTLVSNALDNLQARRYVDSRCVSNRVPLLESGTLGPKGHVQIVIPFKTESYSSQNDPEVSTDIPQCTLKMFPEEAMHCVEWARDQFGKIFTLMPKTVNKVNEEGPSVQEAKVLKKTVKCLTRAPVTFDDCIRLAREKFQKMFHNNVKQLLFAYPLDKKDTQGHLFWTLPKRPPLHLEFNPEDELHASFIAAYACLYARQLGIAITYDNPRKLENKFEMSKKANKYPVAEFKPNQLKAKEIEKEVEKEKNSEEENKESEITLDTALSMDDLLKEYNQVTGKLGKKEFKAEEFEKDNDANFHIDLIHSMANLRCRNYKLEEMDWMKVKIKAGRIIPALATTTAAIAGLQSLELVKIAKMSQVELFRNSFLNLAIPYLQSSEPGIVSQAILKEGLNVTLWDRWEVELSPDNQTLKCLFEYLWKCYGLFPRDCFKGKKAIFAFNAYIDKKDLREEILSKKLKILMGIPDEDEYVDLLVTFTKDELSEDYIKNVPKVRIIFSK